MQFSKTINSPMRAIGLMSGTSLDGVDAALITTDGEGVQEIAGSLTMHYDRAFQNRLREVLMGQGNEWDVAQELTLKHAEAVHALLAQEKLAAQDISVIGFHGQTILHKPEQGITKQIGDGKLLAQETGIDVVCDFRSNDVSLGGQGAPLVPVYHQALMRARNKPVAVLNIGGVANVTWIGENEEDLLAFDTGAGNALINDWVHAHTGKTHDENGTLAAAGLVDLVRVNEFMTHPFFAQKPPKSLDRNSFSIRIADEMSLEDGAATITACTVAAIVDAAKYFPKPAREWLICGGGRHNKTMMQMLSTQLGAEVLMRDIDALGINGDTLEAEAFAYLAVRSLRGLPISFPSTTGVSHAATGGVFYRA
jgi:anhydro-N-acetylmuramic acid kinase